MDPLVLFMAPLTTLVATSDDEGAVASLDEPRPHAARKTREPDAKKAR